ncbi:MAG TPA: ATP-binding cassette domain-containing protein [Gemmatimonadaceae bacterium]|nr:ATP-binding cassette domain-containing protein [Gemmatimonadaceae bacterium]
MSNAAPGLLVDQVRKRYGDVRALDGVSIPLEAGTWLALVGESGAGKSTLVRCINRLEELDGGGIAIEGVDVRERDVIELRRSIGYVPQEGGLLPHWRVLANVALVPRLTNLSDPEARAGEALRLVGLDAKALGRRWPHELSGGQRQRVALARALAAGQGLLLLDEPFGALDAITRSDLHRTVLQVRQDRPLTAVLVTHDVREALLLADRVGVMREGRLEQLAPPAALLRAPATAYVARLLERAEVVR